MNAEIELKKQYNCVSYKVLKLDRYHVPCMLIGEPGSGKTSFVHKLAKNLGYKCKTLLVGGCMPDDVLGSYTKDDKENKLVFTPNEIWLDTEDTIIFLDEFYEAHQMVQAVLLQLLVDRKLPNGVALHPSCIIIGACNNSDRVAQNIKSRFEEIPFPSIWKQAMEKRFEVLSGVGQIGTESPRALKNMIILQKDTTKRIFVSGGNNEHANYMVFENLSPSPLWEVLNNVDPAQAKGKFFINTEAGEKQYIDNEDVCALVSVLNNKAHIGYEEEEYENNIS